jgi:DNA-binding transcriptional MerR regulator
LLAVPPSRTSTDLLQIGDVADRTSLSLRTIRHYEEVGLLTEPQRSPGGFRLYSDEAVERLLLIKRMKPLDFTLEEMRDLIDIRDELARRRLTAARRTELTERLRTCHALVEHKLERLRERVESAEAFARQLGDELA